MQARSSIWNRRYFKMYFAKGIQTLELGFDILYIEWKT